MDARLISRVNDASDALAEVKALTWVVFHAAQSNAVEDELSEGLLTCCNQALSRLRDVGKILDEILDEEKATEGAP